MRTRQQSNDGNALYGLRPLIRAQNEVAVDLVQLMTGYTMAVRLVTTRNSEVRLRIWLAKKLIQLAARVMKFKVKIEQ